MKRTNKPTPGKDMNAAKDVPLTTEQLEHVSGGDTASGLPTGQRMHKPFTP